MKRFVVAAIAAGATACGAMAQENVKVDSELPTYKPTRGVTGSIKSVGSDTMNNLMAFWSDAFKKFYPNVTTEIEGKGSSTAPPALIQGTSNFGPMSRAMKATEIDQFEKKFGYKPTQLRTAVDALAVFVHKDCPLDEISLEQLQRVFSVTGPEMTWGDLGVRDSRYANRPVALYGRNSASGTYGFFKSVALGKKDYKATVKEQPGSSAVVSSIAGDPYGMGYSGLGYATAQVKTLKVAVNDGDPAYAANAANAYSGDYPLARYLYLYVNHRPGSDMDPLRREFIKLIFSKSGQESVVKDGYFPIPAAIAREQLRSVGVTPQF